jgi:hypothetical protein
LLLDQGKKTICMEEQRGILAVKTCAKEILKQPLGIEE